MVASSSTLVVLLTILVLGGALVEAAGRPLNSSTKPSTKLSSLNNFADVENIDEESLVTIPATEYVDEEQVTNSPTGDVDEVDEVDEVMDEYVDEEQGTIPAREDVDGDSQVTIPEFLRDYMSTLDPSKIQQYEASLESNTLGQEFCEDAQLMCDSNVAIEAEGIAKDEVGEMFDDLDDEGQSVTFGEKDIQKDKEIVFPETFEQSTYPSPLFLPHSIAEKIPFSSEKILELMDVLHILHKSKLATIMSHTLNRCELNKEKFNKEAMLTKEKKKIKGSKDVVKEKKIGKEIVFTDKFNGKFGKEFKEKEIVVKKGKSSEVVEFKDKEVKKKEAKWKKVEKKENIENLRKGKEIKKKETKWKKDEKKKGKDHVKKEDEFKKFLEKEIAKKERKKKLEKDKEVKKKGHKEREGKHYKGEEEKFKEVKENEFKTFELEGKKERLNKENEMKKKLWDKEGIFKEEKEHKYKDFKDKEFKEKGLKGKKDTWKDVKDREKKVKEKDIKGKGFKEEKVKEREFAIKKGKLSKERVFKEEIEVTEKESSKETLKCVISVEGMANFVKKNLPVAKHIKALETTSLTKHIGGDYKKIHWKVTEVKKHEKAVVCKKELFPFAVFKCQIIVKSKGVRLYYIKLNGKDGVYRKEVVACEDEKKSKKLEPKVLCRWISNSLIWVPDI